MVWLVRMEPKVLAKLARWVLILCMISGLWMGVAVREASAASGDFVYYVSSGTATITDYTGSGGDVTIPNELGGVPVSAIRAYAFEKKSLTSISIPNGVKTIGDNAFNSNELTSVTLPNSLTTIGNSAFQLNNLSSLTIPQNVTSIANYAFYHNKLTSLTLPDSLTTIGEGAFNENQLSSLNIPQNVTTIGDIAFNYNQLTSLTLPDSLTIIGAGAFNGNQLSSLNIPQNVTTIGEYAFWVNPLTSVVVLGTSTTFGSNALGFSSNTTITAFDPSPAKLYALTKGLKFSNVLSAGVEYSPNGQSTGGVSSTTVKVGAPFPAELSTTQSYQWTQSTSQPSWTNGDPNWHAFASGDSIATPNSTGTWFLHVRVDDGTHTAGFAHSHAFNVMSVDTTPPVLTVPADVSVEATGPQTKVSLEAATATDLIDGDVPVTSDAPPLELYPVGTTVVHFTATDSHGNQASGSTNVTVIDTTPPEITIDSPTNTFDLAGQQVNASWSVSDLVGVEESSATEPNGAFIDTTPGTHTFTVSAKDASGNIATKSIAYTVLNYSGILKPINIDGSSSFKKGSTIPVKFQVTNGTDYVSDLTAKISIAQISNTSSGSELENTSTTPKGNLFRYDSSANQYIFNLSTKNLSEGMYEIYIDITTADGQLLPTQTAVISLK